MKFILCDHISSIGGSIIFNIVTAKLANDGVFNTSWWQVYQVSLFGHIEVENPCRHSD